MNKCELNRKKVVSSSKLPISSNFNSYKSASQVKTSFKKTETILNSHIQSSQFHVSSKCVTSSNDEIKKSKLRAPTNYTKKRDSLDNVEKNSSSHSAQKSGNNNSLTKINVEVVNSLNENSNTEKKNVSAIPLIMRKKETVINKENHNTLNKKTVLAVEKNKNIRSKSLIKNNQEKKKSVSKTLDH